MLNFFNDQVWPFYSMQLALAINHVKRFSECSSCVNVVIVKLTL